MDGRILVRSSSRIRVPISKHVKTNKKTLSNFGYHSSDARNTLKIFQNNYIYTFNQISKETFMKEILPAVIEKTDSETEKIQNF